MKKIIVHGTKGDYIVTEDSCTCPDYIYKKKDIGGSCKHMDLLK